MSLDQVIGSPLQGGVARRSKQTGEIFEQRYVWTGACARHSMQLASTMRSLRSIASIRTMSHKARAGGRRGSPGDGEGVGTILGYVLVI